MAVIDGAEALRQGLAIELAKQRLRIEQINVAGAAFHEQEDDALGLADPMRQLG